MQRLKMIGRFLKFYFQAWTQYRVHSPFIFTFCQEVLDDNREFYAFSQLETLREFLIADTSKIEVTDLGAGTQSRLGATRSVRAIAQSALTSPLYCRFLFRTLLLYKPKTILEMGTSLGLSTLYLAKAASQAKIITLEGCPNTAAIAQKNFDRYEATNIELRAGPFQDTLSPSLQDLQTLDFAFIDGNHRQAPTLDYFEQCLVTIDNHSILVFDDIHWSEEMEAAWEQIKAHPRVTASVDLFFMGIVFFRKDFVKKQHFKLVPQGWKPWVMGFF